MAALGHPGGPFGRVESHQTPHPAAPRHRVQRGRGPKAHARRPRSSAEPRRGVARGGPKATGATGSRGWRVL